MQVCKVRAVRSMLGVHKQTATRIHQHLAGLYRIVPMPEQPERTSTPLGGGTAAEAGPREHRTMPAPCARSSRRLSRLRRLVRLRLSTR